MKVENKKVLNICLVISLIFLIILLILVFLFGRTLSKHSKSINSNGITEIAKPIFIVDGEQNIKIDGIQDTEYVFTVRNYEDTEISDIDMGYTIEVINSSKANLKFELTRNGKQINLNNNKTDRLTLKGIQKSTDEYKLIIKYENNPAIIEDISGNVQIKVEAVQTEVI